MTEQWNEKRQRNKESTGQSRAAGLLLLSVFALAAALLLGRIFPYYYDLNDDALMAQILAIQESRSFGTSRAISR